jgi:GWxTD domain-containing protein
MENVNFSGQAALLKNQSIDYPVNQDLFVKDFPLKAISNPQGIDTGIEAGLLRLELPGKELYPGYYKLTVSQEGSQDTLYHEFKVTWEKEPLSLKDVDYAVKSMKSILTDEEFDDLDSGKDQDKWLKLLAYWKKNDPTPQTPYNEAMTVFFERVDYAFFNYSTVTDNDGSLTDRGLVYILNGAADKVDDSLNESNKVEIWTYTRLGKVYTFETVSLGDFKLKSITDLQGNKLTD